MHLNDGVFVSSQNDDDVAMPFVLHARLQYVE